MPSPSSPRTVSSCPYTRSPFNTDPILLSTFHLGEFAAPGPSHARSFCVCGLWGATFSRPSSVVPPLTLLPSLAERRFAHVAVTFRSPAHLWVDPWLLPSLGSCDKRCRERGRAGTCVCPCVLGTTGREAVPRPPFAGATGCFQQQPHGFAPCPQHTHVPVSARPRQHLVLVHRHTHASVRVGVEQNVTWLRWRRPGD